PDDDEVRHDEVSTAHDREFTGDVDGALNLHAAEDLDVALDLGRAEQLEVAFDLHGAVEVHVGDDLDDVRRDRHAGLGHVDRHLGDLDDDGFRRHKQVCRLGAHRDRFLRHEEYGLGTDQHLDAADVPRHLHRDLDDGLGDSDEEAANCGRVVEDHRRAPGTEHFDHRIHAAERDLAFGPEAARQDRQLDVAALELNPDVRADTRRKVEPDLDT